MTNTGLYNNRNSKAILAFFITMFYLVNPLFSQDREDNQFWTGFDLEYTLFDDLTLEVQNELRQERNAASFRSYYFNLGAKYKIFSFFRVGSFYRYKIHPDYRENAAYVNGTLSTGAIKNANSTTITIGDLGRDIDDTKYGIVYAQSSGTFEAVVYYIGGDAAAVSVAAVLAEATSTNPSSLPSGTFSDTLGAAYATGTNYIYYEIEFTVY